MKRFITAVLLKTDGTNKLIEKGKACITPTNNPFWKYPEDVHSGVRTRSQEKNKKVKSRNFDKYFKQKIFRGG